MSVMVPVLFFLVFILAIAQSAITLKTYADTKKEQDSNYKFSIFFLIFSILGLLVSGFMVYKAGKGDPSPNNAAAATTQLANKLNNLAEQIKQKNN